MREPHLAVAVPLPHVESVRRELSARRLVDRTVRMTKRSTEVLIPVLEAPAFDLRVFGARLERVADLMPRTRPRDPATALRNRLVALDVPRDVAPSGWERLGDVVVVRLTDAARPFAERIGRAVGEVLSARTVVEDLSGIHGVARIPDVRILWGSGTETVHVEDGIRFKLDVARTMFSSGNLAERTSIARRMRAGDVVVDLFAGIGYFALPIALRSEATTVHACEVNPTAFMYLLENIRLNRATKVVPHLGDCRTSAPRGVADRVVLGHFDGPRYLDVAIECLRSDGALLVHALHPKESAHEDAIAEVRRAVDVAGAALVSANARTVKSYAPGIVHVAVEVFVRRNRKDFQDTAPEGSR